MICRGLAIPNQAEATQSAPSVDTPRKREGPTHLALASLTFILGLARSSLNRWLCSRRRRSLSSDIDCLCGRFIMAYLTERGVGLYALVWAGEDAGYGRE